MQEITASGSFIGGSKQEPNLNWTVGEGKAKRKASKPKAKKATKPKAKRTASKAKPKAKKATKKSVLKKKGGDPSTKQRIEDTAEGISFSSPGIYWKLKAANDWKNTLGRSNRVVEGTAEDNEALQRLANSANQMSAQEARETIYNVRRNPYDINQDPYNVDNNGLDVGEAEDPEQALVDGDADAAAFGEDAGIDAGEILEGLADFVGLEVGAGKKKGKKSTKKKARPTNAQWRRKRTAVINKVKKNKKLMKKRGGNAFLKWLENLPTDISDGFVTLHDAVTGKNSWGKLNPNNLPILNTWGQTEEQVVNDDMFPGGTPTVLASERQIHVAPMQRAIPGVIGSDVVIPLVVGTGKNRVGGESKKKEKTQVEIALAEANKMMKEAKRRFENAIKDYYADMKRRLMNENNINPKDKDTMKSLNAWLSENKKAGVDKLKTRIAWATHNAYADELEAVLKERPQFNRYQTGLGPKKKTASKKKTAPKKKPAPKKKATKKPKAKKSKK
jgi:hypothetical protein